MALSINTSYRGIDYGARKGTFGFAVHMTEGNGGIGDVIYLSQRSGETISQWRDRIRGVSANFVITKDGTIYQMVGWSRASGSMNPRDRGDDTGFYRHEFIADVLGTHYVDPNAYSISVEVGGKRADGPTDAQVESLVELVAESRRRYPSLRGAYGHADQTDTKGCPGVAPRMLRFWEQVGHGLFLPETATDPEPPQEEPVGPSFDVLGAALGVATVTSDDANIIATSDGAYVPLPEGYTRNVYALAKITDGKYDGQSAYLVQVPGTDGTGLLLAALCSYVPYVDPLAARLAGVKAKVAALASDVAND